MVIQIRGAGFVNKGAELMLISVVNWFRNHHPNAKLVIDFRQGTKNARRKLGLGDLYWMEYHSKSIVRSAYNGALTLNAMRSSHSIGVDSVDMGEGIRSKVRRWGQILDGGRSDTAVLGRDVDIVLDLSGFAYGDPWGPRTCDIAASYYEQVKRRGGRVVLMPQQLGPFERHEVRESFVKLSAYCDLIFARDQISFEIVNDVVVNPDVVHQCPDFTVLQKGVAPTDSDLVGRACIIPNYKMLRATDSEVRDAYPGFLRRSVIGLREKGIEPIVLIHQQAGSDHEIAERLASEVGGLRIVDEHDPLRVKGIIGASLLTIGSRFHGLVSALSQAVPSLGTSWSHKYQMLFEEYGCSENLVSPTLSDERLREALNGLLNETLRASLVGRLEAGSRRNAQRVTMMWETIQAKILKAKAS